MTRIAPAEDLRLDIFAAQVLGRVGAVEALLDANPGLAAAGGFVTAGETLEVPVLPTSTPIASSVNPWE